MRERIKIYYAHSKQIYNTPQEEKELKIIEKHFPKMTIINPKLYESDPEKRKNNMKYCHKLIDSCKYVVWSKLQGKVTCGVGDEVNYALEQGKKVFQINHKRASLQQTRRKVKHLTLNETMELYYGMKVLVLGKSFRRS